MNLHFSKKDPYQKYASTPKSILKISNFQITNFTERGLSWIFVPSSLLMVFFFLNLKKRKFLSFYCRTSLCVLIDLVQQGVLLSYNLTRLILAHAGNKIIVVYSPNLVFHSIFIWYPCWYLLEIVHVAHFDLYDTYKSSVQCTLAQIFCSTRRLVEDFVLDI